MSEVNYRQQWAEGEIEAGTLLDAIDALATELQARRVQVDTLTEWYANALNELGACAAALPGISYMDLPDGGSPTVAEQVARMAAELAALKGGREAVAWQVSHPQVAGGWKCYERYPNWAEGDPRLSIDALYTAPPAQASAWVAVSERLPTHLEVVLAWVTYSDDEGERQETVDFADFHAPSQDNQWFSPYAFITEQHPHVTHWQPLPAAPTPGASDGKGEA